MTDIIVKHLQKSFKDKKALDDISFSVQRGEIFGFLGPSGAGKSTVINILTGQLSADSGELSVFGKPVTDIKTEDLKNIGLMSETVGFFEKMTVYQNLMFFAKFHKVSTDHLRYLLEELGLWEDKDKQAEALSTGMRQRLLLIRAILHQPRLVFLDEPTSGLDPNMAQKVHNLLLDLKNAGTSIFLTTHNMVEASKLCDNIGLLYKGKIVEYGSPKDIVTKYSTEDVVVVTLASGEEVLTTKEHIKDYVEQNIRSIHTREANLESIFMMLTGDVLDGK